MEDPGIVARVQGSSELDQGLRHNCTNLVLTGIWGQSRVAEEKTLRVSLVWRKFQKKTWRVKLVGIQHVDRITGQACQLAVSAIV